ncbi:MAG: NAD(P)-dependent glycerol-3-phosphate dehydrogenase [Clostridiales bacterium]|nr:NAD(P)-dependent glycerol-3-phosphate dehydrogenase [Clostridiales bacterium]
MRIKILGAGSWGTALALLLYANGHHVSLWSWDKVHVENLMRDGENSAFLPGAPLPADIPITPHISGVASADMVIFSIPSPAVQSVAEQAREFIKPQAVIVNTGKGFSPDGRRLSQVIQGVLPQNPYATLSGPSHAEEVARQKPTTVVVAGTDMEICRQVQDIFMNNYFRVYTGKDLIGVEIGGAVKNIIALAVGIVHGLDLGDNAKAAVVTRGLTEIMRLGVALGAEQKTFAGLAGVGDLVVTCTSEHSRNFRAGVQIGKGRPWNQVVEEMCMVVEGVFATESTWRLAREHKVDMPITEQVYRLLYEGRTPQEAMWVLMSRSKTAEEIAL